MKIAVIGAGNVGGTLARKWGLKGHSIYIGVRDINDPKAFALQKEIGAHASIHTAHDAAQKAEVICLATPWLNAEEAVKSLGSIKEKILIDCTNPLKKDLSGLTHGLDCSGGEMVQNWGAGAHVVKCFNTVGFNIMANPVLENRKVVMFYCGDNPTAKDLVRGLAIEIGFEPIDAGPLSFSRILEPFALLWITSAYKFGLGREFAFSIVRGGGHVS